MIFNLPEPIKKRCHPVAVGNVYVSKNTHKTAAWVVLAVNNGTVHLAGINCEGEITSMQSYNEWVIEKRKLIGICDLSELSFDIEPVGEAI